MNLSSINAISPIDGRYRAQTENLSTYFSENGLIRYRVRVEIEYFIALCEYPLPQLKSLPKAQFEDLRRIYLQFTE
ncbi:MAG: adenylosuccinate lyase, partial [bacterium]|nr:adenylosuccinate lyase [bacterium]